MINEVSISNFKSIEEIKDLKLKPLTILTGVNSSGKSNIMEAISFFAQASRMSALGSSPTTNFVFKDSDVRTYPSPIEDFIVYKKDKRRKVALEISLRSDRSLKENIEALLVKSDDVQKLVFPKDTTTEIETVGYAFSFILPDKFFSQKILINKNLIVEVRHTKGQQPIIVYPEDFHGSRITQSLNYVLVEDAFSSPKSHPFLDVLLSIARQIVVYIKGRAERVYFISGERGRIEPELETLREEPPFWIGFEGQDLVEILSRCFTREPEKARKIREWANKFQIPDIRAGYVGRATLESNFRDDVLDVILNSTLAGLGSRQTLSMITQIFWSETGDTIMIEEPEISLHPENQVLLHELFSEAISQGKQIICSTHSPFFVLALSKIVKKKLLKLDEIAVYEVEKGKQGTTVKTLELNKHGFIVSGIPSFMKVEEDLFRDWSESLGEE